MAERLEFETFVRSNSTSLFATAYLLTGVPADAEDLLQDVWVRLHSRWDRVEAADAPLAYVRRAVVNAFLNDRRKRSASTLTPTLEPGANGTDVVLDRMVLAGSLARLSDRQRAAVVLRYFHDQPDASIAAVLGCRPATVRSLISRGLEHLRTSSDTRLERRDRPAAAGRPE